MARKIKNKKGKVIAEVKSQEEALWERVVEGRQGSIANLESSLKIERVFLVAAEAQLEAAKANS